MVQIGSNAGNTERLASGGLQPPVLPVTIALVSTEGLRQSIGSNHVYVLLGIHGARKKPLQSPLSLLYNAVIR
jgi:hypothetical protein